METIKEIRQNKENLHYPYLLLSDNSLINIATYTMRALYGDNPIGKEYNKEQVFNFEKERAKIEVLSF